MAPKETILNDFNGRVSWKSTGPSLAKIKERFTHHDLLDRALQTQFKSIFQAPTLLFSGTILHQMLIRKVSSNSKEIRFMVKGKEVCWGMKDYALVTGLNFGRFPLVEEVEECPPLVLKYFKGKKDVKLKELEDLFVGCSDKEDSWKMGLIFLIYQYLFASDNRRKISLKIFHMVEDMEMFLQFPWGKVSFRATLQGIDKDIKYLRGLYLSKKKNWNKKGVCDVAYTIHGFALAFQVWTYELIDTFVPNFAEKTPEDDLTSPRIVLYKSFRSYTGPEVSTAIQECTVRRRIHESAEEKRMYSGDDFEDMTNNIYDEFFGCDTRKRKIEVFEEEEKLERTPKPPTKKSRHISPKVPEVSGETSQESSSHSIPSATTPIPNVSTSCAPNRVSQDLTAKLDVLTNVVNEIKKDVNDIKSEIKLMKDNQQLIITLLGQRNEQKNGGGEEKEEAGTAAIDTQKRTTKRKNNNLTLVENRTKRKNDDVDNENRTKRKNDELMNSKRKKTEDDDEITRKRNERKERRERLAILSKKKIADELDKKRNAEKLAKKRKAEKRKSKKEIDEICHLLKRRVEEFPKTYPRNFSIADSNLSQKMSNRYEVFTPNPAGYEFDDLMEYVIGEGSNPWNIVDMIYVPLNIKQKHWVLCKIHLQDWCIYVYDCEQNMFPKDEYDTFLEPMCVMVPYLLEQGFSTSDKQRFPQIKLDAMPYSIIPHPIVPVICIICITKP
ncbi:uncharacterized protein LOC124916037 [Impatiens glandulifera]|uniref:uncharacterized protein LOC124916037 n=1 Tax=Impatiens glandulifera TaxID=253017 RepID=UPI001FB05188|nr:uncharacterized protein LOC124916037 [Impatiens glandulifera]